MAIKLCLAVSREDKERHMWIKHIVKMAVEFGLTPDVLCYQDYLTCFVDGRFEVNEKTAIATAGFGCDWNLYGMHAPKMRDGYLTSYCNHLLAIWDGKHERTEKMIIDMHTRGCPVWVFRSDLDNTRDITKSDFINNNPYLGRGGVLVV